MQSYYLLTYSKVHHKITQEQKDKIMDAQFTRMNMPDGSVVSNSNISDILPESKYFETYPDKRPEEVRNEYQEVYALFNTQVRQPTTRAKELMRESFLLCREEKFGETEEQAKKKFSEFSLFRI